VNSAIKLLFKITSLFLYRMESLFGGDDVVLVMATGGYESFLGGLVVDSDDSDAESDSDDSGDATDDPQDDPAGDSDDAAESDPADEVESSADKKKKKKTKKDMQESTTDEHPNPDITEQDSDEPPLNEELMSDDDEPFGKPSLEDEIVDVAEDAAEALGGDETGSDETGSDETGGDEVATGGETELFGGSEFVGAEEDEAAGLIEQFGGSDLVMFGGATNIEDESDGAKQNFALDSELEAAVSYNSNLVEKITGQSIHTGKSLADQMAELREDDPAAATEEQVAELTSAVEKQHEILDGLFGNPGDMAESAEFRVGDSNVSVQEATEKAVQGDGASKFGGALKHYAI
jgi:hypothetical protein